MRLPFLQVAQEEMARARTLAGYLGVSYAHALGMTVALKAAALEAAPEGDVSGAITDPNPAEWMAVQCGWPLDRAEALATALVRCGFAMAGPSGGHTIAGMEPYARALDTSEKRSDAGRRGAEARKSKGGYGRAMAGPQQTDGRGMARDAKTQTQTQNSPSEAPAVAAPPAGDELPDATDEAQEVSDRPALVLEAQKAGKPERKVPPGEGLYIRLEARREEACDRDGLAYIPSRWPFSRQNKQLGPIAKAEESDPGGEWERFASGWALFLDDREVAGNLDEAYALDYFWRMRGRYEGRALKGGS